jgi:hypothetical protein
VTVRLVNGRQTRAWVLLLLLPALAARLMVPAGFMPGTGADDLPTMQMCHGAGPLPAGDDGGAPGKPIQHDAPCVFAAAGTAAPPPVVLPVPDGPVANDAIAPAIRPAPGYRPRHRAQSPRAPPAGTRPA